MQSDLLASTLALILGALAWAFWGLTIAVVAVAFSVGSQEFCLLTRRRLDPSAGGTAGRGLVPTRAGGNAVGAEAARGHHFGHIGAFTMRAHGWWVTRFENQFFETFTTAIALILVYRHRTLLVTIWGYNNGFADQVKRTAASRRPPFIIAHLLMKGGHHG